MNFLEDMLDSKLRRVKRFKQGVPSFLLDDPDFATSATSNASGLAGDSASVSSAVTGQSGHFSLGAHSVAYSGGLHTAVQRILIEGN